jgi:hypothetical protein
MTTFLPKLHTIFSFVGRVAGFSASGFFSGSPSPGPLGVPLGPSWTFWGVCGDIRGSGCAAGVGGASGGFAAAPGVCLPPVLVALAVAVGVVDAGGGFAAGAGDAGGGFAAGVGGIGGG